MSGLKGTTSGSRVIVWIPLSAEPNELGATVDAYDHEPFFSRVSRSQARAVESCDAVFLEDFFTVAHFYLSA